MSDDGKLILENPQVTQGGHLRELFTTDWFDTGGAAASATTDPSSS